MAIKAINLAIPLLSLIGSSHPHQQSTVGEFEEKAYNRNSNTYPNTYAAFAPPFYVAHARFSYVA
ncbi:hypothetical protein CVT26_010377 [Gymnopilus dilepis]|uniref:Uncharacterized protein n=1 Tax=Gymnopilus dilepis TaxID=231916 RepID=A0A409WRZ7_9AGAR|nr:hypothetical protein CVT26_010377 [Gymnopilus dilepis]